MRLYYPALFVAIIAIFLAGCGEKTNSQDSSATAEDVLSAPDQVVIGISFDSLQVERWQKDRDMFVAAAEALGAKCLFQDANGDAKTQNEQCEQLLAQGADVLVIVPKSATAAAKSVRLAQEQNVPVVSYDRMILNCEPTVYLSFDNRRVGRMQAEYLVSKKDSGKWFLLGGSPDDNNAKLFRQGQMDVIQPLVDAGRIEIVGDQWADDWAPSKAREIVENLLVSVGQDLDVLVASNDGTAGGAIQALRAQGMAGKVLVSGQDADLQACKRILEGTQAMTVYKPLDELAKRGAAVAVALAQGESVAAEATVNNGTVDVPSVLLEPISVDADNLAATVIAAGHHSQEALAD